MKYTHRCYPILDVGGGATSDGVENPLSDIPFRWMIREIIKSECPVHFVDSPSKAAELITVNNDIHALDSLCSTAPLLDVLRVPKYWFWWILEFLPAPKHWEDDKVRHYAW
jgi:hypothetical protein